MVKLQHDYVMMQITMHYAISFLCQLKIPHQWGIFLHYQYKKYADKTGVLLFKTTTLTAIN